MGLLIGQFSNGRLTIFEAMDGMHHWRKEVRTHIDRWPNCIGPLGVSTCKLGLAVVFSCERLLSVAKIGGCWKPLDGVVGGLLRSAGKFTGSYWYVDPMLAFQPVKSDNLGGGV
jgi:hypothetical protein